MKTSVSIIHHVRDNIRLLFVYLDYDIGSDILRIDTQL